MDKMTVQVPNYSSAVSAASSSPDKIIVDRTKKISEARQSVRDVRYRLTSNIGEPIAYEKEMFTSFSQNNLNASIILAVFAAILAVLSSVWMGYLIPFYWFAITLISYLALRYLSKKFLSSVDEIEEADLRDWRVRFFLAKLFVSSCWSLLVLSVHSAQYDVTYSIILFATILVFQASTMMLSYGLGSKVLAASAPPTMLLAILLALTFQPAMVIMAAILLCSQVFFFIVANRFKLSVISLLEHKAERESLIAELETARSMSDEARRRAEEANLAKSRFLATMSHELRTPLNAILGFSEVIRDEVLGPLNNETYKEYVTDIHGSGQHLLNLINEILDLSRIEAGRQELNEEAVKLQFIVEDAQNMIQLKAKSKGVNLNCVFEEGLPQIWADERAVRQIVLNLLSNAVKFTPTGGSISIKLGWTAGGGQYVSIRDTGPGIPEEEIPIVLSSFGQGSIAIKSAEQGTGLGLPIVQALMHMHDGKFELKSKLREGTEVIATFPRSRILEVMPPVKGTSTAGVKKPTALKRVGLDTAKDQQFNRHQLGGVTTTSSSLIENTRASLRFNSHDGNLQPTSHGAE